MAKVLIIYYSQSGNTEKMAHFVEEGVIDEGLEAQCKRVVDVNLSDLLEANGIIYGSPTYYGCMAAPLKELIDKTIKYHGKFEGKIGGAFTSCGRIGGGGETALSNIINTFLIHGMIVQGVVKGSHYGPIALKTPDEFVKEECKNLGRRVAILVKRLF